MKTYFKVAAGAIALSFFWVMLSFAQTPSFSEGQALKMIYGNYDSANKYALWKNIPFPDKKDADGYFEEKKGFVSAIFFQPYFEDGKNKIFLLTKTIPTNIPFDCHACLPLIGATVFVNNKEQWEIEAKNQFIMYDGEYGELPTVKLIAVGKDKFGLSLEFEHVVVRDKELNILILYKNSIVNAYNTVIYYENFNDCEFSKTIQCAAYTASIDFDKSIKGSFYSLKVKKFGTIYRYKKEKAMPIDKAMTYQFRSGRYKSISQIRKRLESSNIVVEKKNTGNAAFVSKDNPYSQAKGG